jgi:hypothetical protein
MRPGFGGTDPATAKKDLPSPASPLQESISASMSSGTSTPASEAAPTFHSMPTGMMSVGWA